MKILIVDDKADHLYMLEALLKGDDYEVVSATNGKEALKRLRSEGADMIISDILMPVMDGFQLCQEVRADETLKYITFIFYTATYTDEKDEEFALKIGADKFLRKPMEPDEFMKILRGVIRDVEEGKLRPQEPALRKTEETFELYSERLVKKLEKKMFDLEREIDERKRAGERIEHLNRVIHAIRSVNQLIVKEKDRDSLLQKACDILIEARGYDGAWLGFLRDDKTFATVVGSGLGKDVSRFSEHVMGGDHPPCIKNGLTHKDQLMVMDKSKVCGDCFFKSACIGKEAAVIRIEHADRFFGLLAVLFAPDVTADEEEKGLLKEVACDIAFGLHDMELEKERKLAWEALRDSQNELDVRNKIANVFLTISDDEMYGEVLQVVLEAMKSKHGIFGYIDHNGDLVAPSMTRDVWDQCRISDKKIVYPREEWGGIWGRALIEKKTLFSNEPFKVPEGHLPISCALVVPVIHHGKVIGTMEVANKVKGYDKKDIQLLEIIVDAIAPVLNGRLQRDKQEGDKKKLETQLQQAQKMEAIGALAGGVAHDFNNLLTTIIGCSDLMMMSIGKDHELRGNLEDIRKAGDRAASLTRQLLAFSRKQILAPKVINLNHVIPDMDKMLRRLIGEDIDLKTVLAPDLGRVEADPGQIEQIIMNLAVNARDAMPRGGKLTMETANVDLNEAYARSHVAVTPGSYVMMAISDSGTGMDEETLSKVFDPFFTTKEEGKGTGLGLSMVYGIVKQSNGNIWVYSEPGKGTTFKIYLPRVEKDAVEKEEVEATAESLTGSETILVVEDNEMVRDLAQTILQHYGYSVLTAQDGEEAIKVSKEHDGPIDLMLTDVVMPKMSGREVSERLNALRPDMKVLYMSGYTGNAIVHHGVLDREMRFIQKPFTAESLARKVREVLD